MKFKLSKESVQKLRGIVSNEANEFVQEQAEEVISFESNPLEYILNKYPSLTDTLSDLLTDYFRDYVTGVFVVAPKPTTFKILLHNGQMFFLTYGPKSWIAKVAGKRYYLLNLNEEESAIEAIARLLELGRPPGSQGPDEATSGESANKEEAPAEEEGGGEEAAGGEEEAGMTESINQKKIRLILINEASLSSADLVKDIEGAGDRGEVLLRKINKGEPIELVSGESVVIDKKKSKDFVDALSKKQYDVVSRIKFTDVDGNVYTIGKIQKTAEFGGGKGSGGGAEQTDIQESAQCLVNAIRYNKGSKITDKDINSTSVKKAASRIDTTASLETMAKFLLDSPDWRVTAISTANVLAENFKGNFKFYRGKGIVPIINNAAKAALKNADISANLNKWNPADIWMATDAAFEVNYPEDLEKLNKLISRLFRDKVLVGVSLKKCEDACHIETFNAGTKKALNKFEKIDPKDKNVFATKDIYVRYSDGRIQFRNFGDISSWQGEIKGKAAAAGKIGHDAVSYILKNLGQPGLSSQKEILAACKAEDKSFVNNFFKLYNSTSLSPKIKSAEFVEAFKSAELGNRTSNYFNVELISQLDKLNDSQKDAFINEVVGYAKSSSSFSSTFVKVS